jgi:hypothetical protein
VYVAVYFVCVCVCVCVCTLYIHIVCIYIMCIMSTMRSVCPLKADCIHLRSVMSLCTVGEKGGVGVSLSRGGGAQ